MKAKQMTVCGVRDGGSVAHRNKKNPFVINTFFSIITFQRNRSHVEYKEMPQNS
jgi:hypothetical protein